MMTIFVCMHSLFDWGEYEDSYRDIRWHKFIHKGEDSLNAFDFLMSFMSWANSSVQLLMILSEIEWTVCGWLTVLSRNLMILWKIEDHVVFGNYKGIVIGVFNDRFLPLFCTVQDTNTYLIYLLNMNF